jgi:preprotein translocase subunit SecE
VARNRKRAKERRSRRPADQVARPGVAAARAERERVPRDPARATERPGETPEALEHAAPDVELADAQLAMGRPELAAGEEAVDEDELTEEAMGTGRSRRGRDAALTEAESGALEADPPGSAVAPRASRGNRLITFIQGSWRELQRVQWPDRQQVMQATGVVVGFVIVAGLFLGLADTVATKLVNLILQ